MSNEILVKAKSHFRDVMSGELKSFYIDEWDTTFYFKRGTNFKNEGKIIELQQQGKTAEALVQMVINKCLDSDGKKVFTDASKTELMNSVDPEVIIKIVNNLTADDDEGMSVDAAVKN